VSVSGAATGLGASLLAGEAPEAEPRSRLANRRRHRAGRRRVPPI